ncbi:MAG: CehA/McbA family metallohydrolase [Bryobacteraceae bacterium]|nr:CehA/McbA family metallohydrolase [Bryobacteraceae bacterium]
MHTASLIAILLLTSAAFSAPRFKGATGYTYSFYVPQSASTPWRPAWSPDARQIAFSMSGSIWRMEVDSTTAYEMTANATYDSSPAWSPDGKWIVYTAEDSRGINLMLLNVATGESTALTRGEGWNLDPVFAPDGRRIAFVRNEPDKQFHVYLMPLEGGVPGAPTRITEPHDFGRPRLYFEPFDWHIQPTFSPDSREMILISNRGLTLGSGAIWRAPLEANAMAKARMIHREETLFRTKPQWSPDGKRILYSSHRGNQYNNLYVLPVDGGEPYQLTFGAYDHFDPAWSPDGEWIAYIANEHGVSDLRVLRTFGGEEKPQRIVRRVHRRPMGRLEVALREEGRPTAARVYLDASDGKTYAPETAYQRIAGRFANRDFFHAENSFVVDVPAGELAIEAVKGIEYQSAAARVTIRPGALTRIELPLRRLTSAKASGWYSASDHIHMNYAGNLHNTPENLMMMARAEDLDVVADKVANKDNRIFDHQHYTREKLHALSNSRHLLRVDQEYRPPFYGHVNFINLTKHLISPFTTGYEGTAIDSLYPSNTDMFRLARAQGALGGYVHPWSNDPTTTTYGVARGFPVDLALQTFDYLEVLTSAGMFTHTAKVWHRALNCGFRVTASAGEDSILGLHATPIMGSTRVYAHLGSRLSWPGWVDAIRHGRTFVTNGPILQFTVNHEMPGAEIRLPETGGQVEIAASFESIVPIRTMEIFFNGSAIESVPVNAATGEIRKSIPITTSGWLTFRASNPNPQHPIDDDYVTGETSPVYVMCGGKPIRSRQDAEYFIRWIDDITKQAEAHPGWRSEKEKKHVLGQFAEARSLMEQRR